MNGIVGYVNYNKRNVKAKEILETMTNQRDIELDYEEEAIIYSDSIIILKIGEQKYKIAFTGELYNSKEIKEKLYENNIELETNYDAEKIVRLYSIFKENCVNYLKGIFTFAIIEQNSEKIFIARDHFGVKPLFYTIKDDTLIFSSDIKKIFKYPEVKAVLDKNSIAELFGLSPARKLGSGIFKNIKEVKPGHFIIYTKNGIIDNAYFNLIAKEHTDSIEETVKKVHDLIEKSTLMQINNNDDVATFLSGGIDSSLLTAITAKRAQKIGKKIKTFSVDYVDNDKNFKANAFQPARDNYYIDMMSKKYNTEHEYILLDTSDLVDTLSDAVHARGLPSMADVDSSLYMFCKKVKEKADIVLSGEFADEVFGGYPWFYREDALNSRTFPWSIALDERQLLMKDNIRKSINIKEYVAEIFANELENVPILESFTDEEKNIRRLQYLTLYYFGETLIDRTDRMAGLANLNVRVPFVDYELVQYVYNIPWQLKNYNNMEKGILREAFKDYIPEEIKNRKKSPYPKTYNPNYLQAVKTILTGIIDNPDEPLHKLIDDEFVRQIIATDGSAFTRPWFGQLMTGPQLMAYLIQLNIWLEEYKPEIEL